MSDPSGKFSLKLPGEVEVQERCKERNVHDYYDSVSLAKEERDDIELTVHLNSDKDEERNTFCELEFQEVHIRNEETDRAFHIFVDVRLQRPDVVDLHAYLGFLLALRPRDPCP